MAKGSFTNLSFRAGSKNTESGVVDKFSQQARPKLKFNFTISFKFRQPVFVENNVDGEAFMAEDLTFALKQASRPNPTVIFQDVNYYNFRTKVGTRVEYGTMQLMFYDDVENFGHNVYETYLKSISPIANINKEQVNSEFDVDLIRGPQNFKFLIGNVNEFESGTGSIGPLSSEAPGGELGILENITLRHWFFSETERRADQESSIGFIGPLQDRAANTINPDNIQFVEYQFLNPKIVNMTLDELDMTQSEVSTIMMNFVYDSVFINSPKASRREPTKSGETTGDTFTFNDVRSKIVDVQRLIRQVRRLDTLPDISILETAGLFIPPISGNLPNIQLPKPAVDILNILGL